MYVVENVEALNTKIDLKKDSGDISLRQVAVAEGVYGDEFYFSYRGATADSLLRSALVNKCQILDIRATDAKDLVYKKKVCTIKLSDKVNGGLPISGQDYILNVGIENFVAIGDDSHYGKFGCVHGLKDMTASDFYKKLAISLVSNLSRDPWPILEVSLEGVDDEIKLNSTVDTLTGTATGLVITEADQRWVRGTTPFSTVRFTVSPQTVYDGTDDMIWGTTKWSTGEEVPNSKKVADMEWFFHKERGDQYGMVGYPRVIDTKYMVDPDKKEGYSFIDIHFFYAAQGTSVQHSDQTITLVGDSSKLNTIVTNLETILSGTNVKIFKSKNWSGASSNSETSQSATDADTDGTNNGTDSGTDTGTNTGDELG